MLVLWLAVFLCGGAAFASYYDAANDGDSPESAYILATLEDLKLLCRRIDDGTEPSGKYYRLEADIDITQSDSWQGLGTSNNPFTGHLDGNNHTINMNITGRGLYDGLVRYMGNPREDNSLAGIKDLNITGSISGRCSSPFVHYLMSGTVEGCSFDGTVTVAEDSEYYAGGIAAHMLGGIVRACSVRAEISAGKYAGGIAGEITAGDIIDCTVELVTLITGRYTGGIAGRIAQSFGGNLQNNRWPDAYSISGEGSYVEPDTPQGMSWNGHRYQFYDEAMTWEEAKARCESQGGHLATITSEAEQQFIMSVLEGTGTGFWLGAQSNSFGWWSWVTDEAFEEQYSNFSEGRPDGSGGFLWISAYSDSNRGKWDNVPGGSWGFICEWDDEPKEIEVVPVSSYFQRWLDTRPSSPAPDDDIGYGAIPDPVDTSHLNSNPPRNEFISSSIYAAEDTLPESYDIRKVTGLPPVRNQGKYQTCWAFASLGAMEINYMMQNMKTLGESPDLSELHLAWFAHEDDSGSAAYVLNKGGNPSDAISFLNKKTSPILESDMPYASADRVLDFLGGRRAESFDKVNLGLKDVLVVRGDRVTSYDASPVLDDYLTRESTMNVKKLITRYGAVYFHYYHDWQGCYDNVHTSFYSPNGKGEYHAALIVGWDDNYPAENFINNPGVNGAWLVRTSWGDKITVKQEEKQEEFVFQDNGCFWMSYAQAGPGERGLNMLRVFTVKEESEDTKGYSNNENGPNRHITSEWQANIFRSSRNENLTDIAFYTTDNNVEYEVYVNRLRSIDGSRPSDPGEAGVPLVSGTQARAGYIEIPLPQPVALYDGDYYSVIIRMKLTSEYKYHAAVEGSISGWASPDVREREGFFAEGDPVPSKWEDGRTIDGGPYNACITSITVPRRAIILSTPPSIETLSLSPGDTGREYRYQLIASGNPAPLWRCGSLPDGLTLSSEGLISGIPGRAGEYEIDVLAVNDAGIDSAALTLRVRDSGSSSDGDGGGGGCSLGYGVLGGIVMSGFAGCMLRRKRL